MSPMNPRLLRPLARRQAPAPAPTDPYFSQVSLLLHMDGANESTTFTDSSANALSVTAYGDAQITTSESKFGGASGSFDGAGDYLQTASSSAFALEQFTIEAWIYVTAWGGYNFLVDFREGGGELVLGFTPSGEFYTFASGVTESGGGSALPTGEWMHVAVTYDGEDFKHYLNGQLHYTLAGSGFSQEACAATVGSRHTGTQEFFTRYMDDFRVTKAVRYTANFTPPTAAFQNQ